ncbi:MAG TPA: acyloxyacyl hydrolase [Aequorivita sp.]|nr:acyloxyacyl hydrolase [Aequorivita sp.]
MKRNAILFLFLIFSGLAVSQTETDWKEKASVITPEIRLGVTSESNDNFPETKLQKQWVIGLGRSHVTNPQEWAFRLKAPKTGMEISVTDFGNLDSLGIAVSVMPFLEFKAFRSEKFKIATAVGTSLFSKKYHPANNPNNRAVTTNITWAFKLYLYYQFLSTKNLDWRVGLGYSHHSNGHTKLMNQGYNSFMLGISADIHKPMAKEKIDVRETPINFQSTVYNYLAIRGGLGQNVFAEAFNEKKDVYTIAFEYGRVYDRTFKLGVGFYYRFYEHYYNYITDNESLVQAGRKYDYFKSNPWYYSTNLGVSVHGEVLLNHVGIDLQLGYNLHKPAYQLEWKINEGWEQTPREIPTYWELGELGSKYKIKHRISSRLGMKFYLIGMEKSPKNNLYFGIHLNANLGQADFTEMSLGYVRSFNFRVRD